ncbi:MAG: alpha/beta fold hydrolase [Gammaproteobacteria bacterium]|jgi:pimeloyl-ACP methyl ester carboxylesterase|nr:alpha/beta fold hydrolase [Gammaproteobacteria bacterium]
MGEAPDIGRIRVGDIDIASQVAGQGFPLVLVHGFTGSKLDFQDHLPALTTNRQVIAYDQRGHGSSTNAGPYAFDVLVADLVKLLDALGMRRCDLLGHSLGGTVAMRAVLAHPDRFRSLVLMDTASEPLRLWSWLARRQLRRRVRRHGCSTLLEDARTVPPTPAQQRGIDFVGEDEYWRRRAWALDNMDARAFCELMDELQRHRPFTSRLSGLRCPVTVLVGECDLPFRAPSARMAEAIPGARLVTIPDAEHSPQLENAAAWRGAVIEHLGRIDSPAGSPGGR